LSISILVTLAHYRTVAPEGSILTRFMVGMYSQDWRPELPSQWGWCRKGWFSCRLFQPRGLFRVCIRTWSCIRARL